MSEENTAITWQQAKLLNAYYRKVGLTAAGKGDGCPTFSTFRAGYNAALVGPDTNDGVPTVADIPMKLAEIENVFHRGVVQSDFSDDTALCVCEIPKGAVSEPVRFNVIGIYDQSDTLVAAACTLTDWLTPEELDRSYLSITFPMELEEGD